MSEPLFDGLEEFDLDLHGESNPPPSAVLPSFSTQQIMDIGSMFESVIKNITLMNETFKESLQNIQTQHDTVHEQVARLGEAHACQARTFESRLNHMQSCVDADNIRHTYMSDTLEYLSQTLAKMKNVHTSPHHGLNLLQMKFRVLHYSNPVGFLKLQMVLTCTLNYLSSKHGNVCWFPISCQGVMYWILDVKKVISVLRDFAHVTLRAREIKGLISSVIDSALNTFPKKVNESLNIRLGYRKKLTSKHPLLFFTQNDFKVLCMYSSKQHPFKVGDLKNNSIPECDNISTECLELYNATLSNQSTEVYYHVKFDEEKHCIVLDKQSPIQCEPKTKKARLQ